MRTHFIVRSDNTNTIAVINSKKSRNVVTHNMIRSLQDEIEEKRNEFFSFYINMPLNTISDCYFRERIDDAQLAT